MSEWDNIQGFGGWREKLGELLAEAQKAAQNEDATARFRVSERLNQFVAESWPNDDKIQALDKVAVGAARGLMLSTLEERLKSLVDHNTELTTLTKMIQSQSEAAAASAKAIRLERVNKVLSTFTESVNAIRDFRTVLEKGPDDELTARLERVMKAIQDLRRLVEREA
ncbi:MAG: hypothetical protein H6Q44_722 [Deltaproteobacteria bacterium]|jgi:ElaB/YqjD/DUF883 family membrane-anchored ribosome-binding protein|nr:hypothetical protein [Deltaproteobacteria bacterium]